MPMVFHFQVALQKGIFRPGMGTMGVIGRDVLSMLIMSDE